MCSTANTNVREPPSSRISKKCSRDGRNPPGSLANLKKQADLSDDTLISEPVMRLCILCRELKPLTAFHRAVGERRKARCAKCRSETRSDRGKRHGKPYRRTPAQARAGRLRRKYGITVEQYDQMMAEQENRCAMCHQEAKQLVVDHCHRTGEVRALLCGPCNRRLGVYETFADLAAMYLAKYGK